MRGHFLGSLLSGSSASLFALLFVVPSIVSLGACSDGEDREKILHASITSDQRHFMADLALGQTENVVLLVALFADPSGDCPMVVSTDSSLTIKGGCTDEDGDRWNGSLSMTSSLSGVSIELDDFGTTSDEGTFAMSGDIDLEEDLMRSDLELGLDDERFRVESRRRQVGEEARVDEGTVELVGLGYADLDGQWSDGEDGRTGTLELRGQDTLKFDFSNRDANGCAITTLDGVLDSTTCIDDDGFFLAPPSPAASMRAVLRRLLP